jgi:hypothetical protein
VKGICLRSGSAPGTKINYNSIIDNGVGLDWTIGLSAVDARFNYWGDSSGPSGVGPGQGQSALGNVTFDPWFSSNPQQTTTQISTNPQIVDKYVFSGIEGTTFQVDVRIQSVVDLYGFEFNVTWNTNLIQLVQVQYTTQLNVLWTSWTKIKNESQPGWYRLIALALAPSSGFTGSNPLAKLTFKIKYAPCYIQPDCKLETRIHFAQVKLSNSMAESITAMVYDGKYVIHAVRPCLSIIPASQTCSKLGQTFTVEIKALDVFKAYGIDIEIRYNKTLLQVADIQWGTLTGFLPGPYLTKAYTHDELNGKIRFHVLEDLGGGAPLAYGDRILATVQFSAIGSKVWKSSPTWVNYILDSIAFTNWNITVSDGGTYHQVGNLVRILDAEYRFVPIQGDTDRNGVVDIFDLTAVAAYYGVGIGNPLYVSDFDIKDDGMIDLFDLVLIATNYGYQYNP